MHLRRKKTNKQTNKQKTDTLDNLFFRRISADVVTAGLESPPDKETSNAGNRSRLGEGEGRRNPVSDDEFREKSNNLKPDENTDGSENGTKKALVSVFYYNKSKLNNNSINKNITFFKAHLHYREYLARLG